MNWHIASTRGQWLVLPEVQKTQYKIIKCVLIGQNTTVLAKMVHRVSKVSTTCFGLYIDHRQVCI